MRLRLASPRVVIVGGGVIGAAVGYYLAREGADVTVLEREGVAAGTSGACEGLLLLQSKKPGIHLQMAVESIRMYEGLSEELRRWGDIEFRRTGGLFIIEDEGSYARLRSTSLLQAECGVEVRFLTADEVLDLEPALSPPAYGAAYTASDGKVNPMALCFALAAGIKALGGRLLRGVDVTGLMVRSDRVCGVTTSQGGFEADIVVNAAGVWANAILKGLGFELPIRPRRGQILVTEAVEPTLLRPVVGATYAHFKFGAEAVLESRSQFQRLGGTVILDQHAAGNFLLGSTREFVGYDGRVTVEGLSGIAGAAVRLMPRLANTSVIRCFAGFRPHTPDGLPVLGAIPGGPEGLVMAAGHEGDGITLAPLTAKWISGLIMGCAGRAFLGGGTDGAARFPAHAFSAARFSVDH